MLVQRRRDSRAALRLTRKLLKKQGFAPKLPEGRQEHCGRSLSARSSANVSGRDAKLPKKGHTSPPVSRVRAREGTHGG